MIAVLLFAGLCLAVGFPFAVLQARDEQPRWASLATEGLFFGLGWFLVLGLALARLGWLGRVEILLPTVALATFGWVRAATVLRRWPPPRPTWFGGAVTGLLVIGAFLRRDAIYFIFQTADFGEYVNRANIVADGGRFHDWFLHLFSIVLALSNVALGEAGTVDVVPFLGLLVVAGVGVIGQRLGFGRIALVVILALLVVEPVAVWFSRFPASETLYAALLVAFLLFTLLAVQRGHYGPVAMAAGFAGLMMVTRPNAVLLAPVLVFALGVCAVLVSRPALRMVAAVVGASTLTLYAGFIYNARNSAAYFVDAQLEAFTPGPLFSVLDTLNRPVEALVGLVVVFLGLVVTVGAAFTANRWVGPSTQDRLAAGIRLVALPAVAAAMLLLLFGVFLPVGLLDAMPRYGWLFLTVVAIGVMAVLAGVARWPNDANRVVGVMSVMVGGSFILLFAHRLPEAHAAPYHLYWDRYLFSEVFPVMAIIGLWGAAALVGAYRWLSRGRSLLPVAGAALVAVLTAAGVQVQDRLQLQRERVLFDSAYQQFQQLDELATPNQLPIIYSGMPSGELPEGWFHTNTYRVFALPLEQSFGREVLNIAGVHPFAPDPRPTEEQLAGLLRSADESRAVLIEVSSPRTLELSGSGSGAPRGAPVVDYRRIGSMTMAIPLLPRQLDPDEEKWRTLNIDLDVWLVELAPATEPAGASR